MRRIFFSLVALLVAACGFALDGYSGGPASPDGGGLVEAGSDVSTAPPSADGSTAPADPAMLVTATSDGTTHLRRWDASTATWGAATDGPTVPNDDPIRGVIVRRSAVNGHRSLAIYTINGTTHAGTIYFYDWNGSKFVQLFRSTDFGPSAGFQPFDLAFDGKSGHGIFVYGGGASGNLRLRTFDGAKWSDEKDAFSDAPNSEPYQFVKLVTRPGTDDAAVLWSDQGSNINSAMWLGDHFGQTHGLSGQTSNDVQLTFDGAFESKRGDLVVAWASDGSVLYSVTEAGANVVASQTGDLHFAETGRVVMAEDPESDQIALVTLEQGCGMQNCDDFTGIIWTGTAWDTAANGTIDGDITTSYTELEADAPATVAWADTEAVALYLRDSDGFKWGNWNAGVWRAQPDYQPATTIGQKASFVPFHIDGKLYTLVEDRKGTLWNVAYDGTSWHDADTNQSIADLPSPTDFNGLDFATDAP